MFPAPFGLRQFGTIAYNAFMEVAQQPVYLLLMTCSGFFCVFLSVVPYFAFGDDRQLVKTSTLAVMLLTGLFGAVLSASSSVAREIRSGTALAVLSKPVGRARFILGKYVGLSGALMLLLYANLVACLLASRMAYDAYGSADTFSFAIYCLGGLLAAFVAGGFLNYFLQVRFVITTVIAVVILTTAMFAIILTTTEAETTGAGADPRLVDWRLISASALILFAVLILTALALACSTRLELLPTLAICSSVLFLGLMSDWLFLARAETDLSGMGGVVAIEGAKNEDKTITISNDDSKQQEQHRVLSGKSILVSNGDTVVEGQKLTKASWWASILYTVTPNWQNFWLADVLEGDGKIPTEYIGQAFGYLVGYVGATLSLALWLFEDRELT
jgi:ABC-type transport system involved in multi-copper enzyme maturation permease subunit